MDQEEQDQKSEKDYADHIVPEWHEGAGWMIYYNSDLRNAFLNGLKAVRAERETWRIKELGQVVLNAHQELSKWRPENLPSIEKTKLSSKLTDALEEQFKWATAIEELYEESEE